MTFFFKRRVGYYLIQVYFPDIFVVTLSWIVFWMDKDEMGDRMALGITTILTIMFLLGSLNGTLPKVSYPKALDWYLLVSFSFVFMSLVECMVVFILNLNAADDKKRMKYKVCSKVLLTVFAGTYNSRVRCIASVQYICGIYSLCVQFSSIDQFGSIFYLFVAPSPTKSVRCQSMFS